MMGFWLTAPASIKIRKRILSAFGAFASASKRPQMGRKRNGGSWLKTWKSGHTAFGTPLLTVDRQILGVNADDTLWPRTKLLDPRAT